MTKFFRAFEKVSGFKGVIMEIFNIFYNICKKEVQDNNQLNEFMRSYLLSDYKNFYKFLKKILKFDDKFVTDYLPNITRCLDSI